MKIRVGIVGYGNIGKAIEKLLATSREFELVGIFSRRAENNIKSPFGTPIYSQNMLLDDGFQDKIDVLLLAVGSANDLQSTALKLAGMYCTVDSFDTHAKMKTYIHDLDAITKLGGTLSIVGCGWDPGLFSLVRALFASVMPSVSPQTFWGKGVSQGHSEAVRRLPSVKYAVQYTIPKENAITLARRGKTDFSTREKHERVCYVVPDYALYFAKDNRDVSEEEKLRLQSRIKEQIVTMPNYFADYDTTVHFVDEEEFLSKHAKMSHAGQVICVEQGENASSAEFSLSLESNPMFTAQVMLAYVRAIFRMYEMGEVGAMTVLDVPIKYLIHGDGLNFI